MASTFETYADRLEAGRLAPTGTLLTAVRALDTAVAEVEGRGFAPTPFAPAPELAEAVGIGDAELWIKDETSNVSGSHKARHLFGVALAHALEDSDGASSGTSSCAAASEGRGTASCAIVSDGRNTSPYAIASCGNAALAAAVMARAVGRPIDVFVPAWANDAVVNRITELGGRVVRCEREPGVPGDPAHHAMVAATEAGAVPFSCQGTDTPATIDGGRTLAWEMVDTLIEHDGGVPARLDRLFVQVGGGALATAVVTGMAAAVERNDLERLPVVHAVQPQGNHPLVRAWDTLSLELLTPERAPNTRDRSYFLDRIIRAQAVPEGTLDNGRRATIVHTVGPTGGARLGGLVRRLHYDAERYMRAWEKEPVSYASGILDDITYDWVDIVEAMLATGGWPLVASEDDFRKAHRLAHRHTDIDVCPTGAAGLGGLLALTASSGPSGSAGVSRGERVAVLFTGRMRPGDPNPLENGSGATRSWPAGTNR